MANRELLIVGHVFVGFSSLASSLAIFIGVFLAFVVFLLICDYLF